MKLTRMSIKHIRNDDDLNEALKLIEANWDAEFGSNEAEELDALTTLVESYEEANHAIEATVPVEVSKKTGATDE